MTDSSKHRSPEAAAEISLADNARRIPTGSEEEQGRRTGKKNRAMGILLGLASEPTQCCSQHFAPRRIPLAYALKQVCNSKPPHPLNTPTRTPRSKPRSQGFPRQSRVLGRSFTAGTTMPALLPGSPFQRASSRRSRHSPTARRWSAVRDVRAASRHSCADGDSHHVSRAAAGGFPDGVLAKRGDSPQPAFVPKLTTT